MRQQIEIYLGPLSDEEYAEVYNTQANYQLAIYKHYLKLFPGVAETLNTLKSRDKHLAVVSARRQETLLVYLRETGIYDIFDVIVSPGLTNGKSKPDPEPALKALALMNGTAEQALFVGDVDSDIECGQRAGMDTAFATWSHNHPDSLKTQPTFFLNAMQDLIAW
jgi:pyrophosphatase PpaX